MEPVTLCITMGLRPQMLRRALESLLPFNQFAEVLAVNDFGDEVSTAVFRELCPNGTVVKSPTREMHHIAVDEMYRHVRTPLIMHCEDDWEFDTTDVLSDAYSVLTSDPMISCVALASLPEPPKNTAQRVTANGTVYHLYQPTPSCRFGSHTFRPSLLRRETWQRFGPYARYTSEGKISLRLKAAGMRIAYLDKGFAHHIGRDNTVASLQGWKRLRRNVLTRYYAMTTLAAPHSLM